MTASGPLIVQVDSGERPGPVIQKPGLLRGFWPIVEGQRNWDIHWETGQQSSNNSCSLKYRGAEPFSEVEVRNVRDFLLKHRNDIKVYVSLHSYSSMVLMPYSFSKCEKDECINKPDNYADLLEMAKLGNSAIKAVGGKEYELVSCVACRMSASGFSGASMDWTQAVAKIPFSFGLELPPAAPSAMRDFCFFT